MNRLADETSPYLRQHAANPVDWYPWGEEAFAEAVASDRPVLLSVGYSACHWCHVMAHESFEDSGTAAEMNRRFVNVKVDREERPDVDAVYMQAVQAMTGHGGWPMTVFLTPDGRPFFGGTYFPKEDRPGMSSFRRVLEAVDDAWRNRRADLDSQASHLAEALARGSALQPAGDTVSVDILRSAYAQLRERFEPRYGGFGRAPKFPPSTSLDFLLRRHARTHDDESLAMVRTTLDAMAAGGVYDQVGGGFHRYSVDDYWLVPHFEKMLYDQALLVRAYLHGHLVTGEPRWRRVVEETVGYVLRDLRQDGGGFSSAEDADSEGEEGRFYVWGLDEIQAICGGDTPAVAGWFGVTASGNFEGANILHAVTRDAPRPAEVERALPKLFAARAQRVRPGLDDKVLLEWNALFLRALAEAAAALGRDDWMDAARTNASFLLDELRRPDGRFLRSWQAGEARHLAYAQDHAALLEALCTLAEVDDVVWLDAARGVAEQLIQRFVDDEAGGFFTTGDDAPDLVVRPKDLFDGATPSANSLAADGLLRLATLTGDRRYGDAAGGVLSLLAEPLRRQPSAFPSLLEAVERVVLPSLEVAVVGTPGDEDYERLRHEVLGHLLPGSVTAFAPPDVGADRTPLLADRALVDGAPAAYVCEGYVCRRPVTTEGELSGELDAALARAGAA